MSNKELKELFADIKEIFVDYDDWDKEEEEEDTGDSTNDIYYEEIFDDYEPEDTLYDSLYWDNMIEIGMKEAFNRERNIRRDKKGRLNKGAQLAKGSGYDKWNIWEMKKNGMSNNEIMEVTGCSRPTIYNAYNAIEKLRENEKERFELYEKFNIRI